MAIGTRCPYMSVSECKVVRGAAAPKGPMTFADSVSVIVKGMGLEVEIWALRLEFGL